MKGLIRSGWCLTLLWLASPTRAQEVPGKAFTPIRNEAPAVSSTGVRAVSLSSPVPLDPNYASSPQPLPGKPMAAPPGAIIRAQADDKGVAPLPVLSNDSTQPVQSKPLPQDNKDSKDFNAPAPAPIPSPYSVTPLPPASTWNSLGIPDLGTGSGCCSPGGGSNFGCFNDGCCPSRGRGWVSAEYLMWWQRSDSVPPLVTASPAGTPLGQAGILGAPTTTIVDSSVPNHTLAGARFDAGWWFQNIPNLAIEANFLFLGRQSDSATFASGGPGNIQLSRPFFNVNPAVGAPREAAEQVANDFLNGTVRIDHYSQLWGIEGLFRYQWLCTKNCWLDVLVGYRHLDLSEGIDIYENLTTIPDNVNFLVHDSFHTRNEFNGVTTGLAGQWQFAPRWFVGSTMKLSMGSTYEIVNINGSTTVSNLPAGLQQFNGTQQGGLYALSTNIGRYTANRFAVLPEMSFKIGYNVTQNLQVFVGYDFLYLSNVVRPGEQIDQNVNPNFIPPATAIGPRQPTVLFRTSDYWAQGLNFGLLYRF